MELVQSNERRAYSSVVEDKFQISNQFGGISKDTWIISDEGQESQERGAAGTQYRN
jgi:uncharacterized circularly permuted ATP-grasp superfamily protein